MTKENCPNGCSFCSCNMGSEVQNLYSFASEDRDMLHQLFMKTNWDEIPMIQHVDDLRVKKPQPVTKAAPKVEKEKSAATKPPAKGIYGAGAPPGLSKKSTVPPPTGSSSLEDATPRDGSPSSPATSAGHHYNNVDKKKANAARRETKEAEARKVALAAATPAPEAPREEKLPPQVQCRLCDKPIQPKKEEYFEYSCGPDYNKEVCVFNTHKMCLTAWYKANRGATNKSEWKNTQCITGDCEENMLCVYLIAIDLDKKTHMKSNINCKNEGKKAKNKKEQKQAERTQGPAEPSRRPAQETVVQPAANRQQEEERQREPSGSKAAPPPLRARSPPVSSTAATAVPPSPVAESQDPENPLRLAVQESLVHLAKKKDEVVGKYETKPTKLVRTKKQKQKKTLHADLKFNKPSNDDSPTEETPQEMTDRQMDFPYHVDGRVTYPKPGTPEGKGFQDTLLTSLKPIITDLPRNCPECTLGQCRPVREILDAILMVETTVGGCGLLEEPQILFLRELFEQGLPRQGMSHLKDFILSLGFFSVSWNHITQQWQYMVNTAGQHIQQLARVRSLKQMAPRDLVAEMRMKSATAAKPKVTPKAKTMDAEDYQERIEKVKRDLATLNEILTKRTLEYFQEFLDKSKEKEVDDESVAATPEMRSSVTLPVRLNSKPCTETQGKRKLFVKRVETSPSSSSSSCTSTSEDSQDDLMSTCQRDLKLVSSNIAHCDILLKNLTECTRYKGLSSSMATLKSEYQALEMLLRRNVARLEAGEVDIEPVGPIPEVGKQSAALFKQMEGDAKRFFDKRIEPYWPAILERVQTLATEANQLVPSRDTIKFELIMELQNQEKDSFDTQRAVENICFNLGVPYYRPMAVVEGADDECAICLEKMYKSQGLTVHPECGNYHHNECLEKWLATTEEGMQSCCPHCRGRFLLDNEFPHLSKK